MKQSLFHCAILWHPLPDKQDEQDSKVLMEPKWMVAEDQNSLFIQLAREIPKEYLKQTKQVDILIKPF